MNVAEQVDAKKNTLKKSDALKLAGQASELYVAKGKKVLYFNLKKDKLTKKELAKLILGPTGNLRAPTLRKGKKLVIGFDRSMYDEVFG